jgi:hypothetical protein
MGPTEQQPMTSRRGGIIKAAFFLAFIVARFLCDFFKNTVFAVLTPSNAGGILRLWNNRFLCTEKNNLHYQLDRAVGTV